MVYDRQAGIGTALRFAFDDGGRSAAGFRGAAGDCVCRSIAIATSLPYREVYDALNGLAESERTGKRKRGRSSARTGVYNAHAQSGTPGAIAGYFGQNASSSADGAVADFAFAYRDVNKSDHQALLDCTARDWYQSTASASHAMGDK